MTIHHKARSTHPAYPARTPVSDEQVPWSAVWFEYAPVEFTHATVVKNNKEVRPGGWADPPQSPRSELQARLSHCGRVRLNEEGLPVNPVGRTGMKGRGLLGKWGPNHAADPIVTRNSPSTQKLEMVAIKRKDTGEWAIPGGMVDDGEIVSVTLKREFSEEAMGNHNLSDASKEFIRKQVDTLFASGGVEVYKGYVDDPRNTDNAWMETVAMHFHCNDELGSQLYLEAADDAEGVRWLQIEDNNEALTKLYASHHAFVEKVLERFAQENQTRQQPQASAVDTQPAPQQISTTTPTPTPVPTPAASPAATTTPKSAPKPSKPASPSIDGDGFRLVVGAAFVVVLVSVAFAFLRRA